MGDQPDAIGRHRRQWPDEDRDDSRRGAPVPGTADHVPLPADHDVPRGASHCPGDGRTGRSHSAIVHSDRTTGVGGNESGVARSARQPLAGPGQRRYPGTGLDCGGRGRACKGGPGSAEERRRGAAAARDARGGHRRLGLRGQRIPGYRGEPRSVPQYGELAGAAGKSHFDPAEGAVRSAPDHDGKSRDGCAVDVARHRARPRDRRRGLHVVAETGAMRSLRSTLVLVVVLAGLVGYIYYLNGRDTTSTDAKEKAFASVKEEDVEDIRINRLTVRRRACRRRTAPGRSSNRKRRRRTRESCRRLPAVWRLSKFNAWLTKRRPI